MVVVLEKVQSILSVTVNNIQGHRSLMGVIGFEWIVNLKNQNGCLLSGKNSNWKQISFNIPQRLFCAGTQHSLPRVCSWQRKRSCSWRGPWAHLEGVVAKMYVSESASPRFHVFKHPISLRGTNVFPTKTASGLPLGCSDFCLPFGYRVTGDFPGSPGRPQASC